MLALIIPTRTDALLLSLLDSLEASSPGANYELIIADNGLSSNTRAKFPAATFVEVPDPFCFARAVNSAVRHASPEADLVILNDDVVIRGEQFITWMQRALFLAKAQGYGVISPVIEGGVGNGDQTIDPETRGIVLTREPICFVTVAIPRAVWNELGGLDESFPGYGYEDTDFSRRVVNEGWMLGITGAAHVKHGTEACPYSTTFMQRFGSQYGPMFDAARTAYRAKWGVGPQLGAYSESGPDTPRPIPLDWLPPLSPTMTPKR